MKLTTTTTIYYYTVLLLLLSSILSSQNNQSQAFLLLRPPPPSLRLQQQQRQQQLFASIEKDWIDNSMGLAASKNKSSSSSSSSSPPTTKNNNSSKNTNQKEKKYSQEWTDVVNDYVKGTLDPSYLHYPIRGSTVNAALLYPSSSSSSAKGTEEDTNYLLPGTHKHLGGVQDTTDGCIYGVPANSHSILCLYPSSSSGGETTTTKYAMKSIPLPSHIQKRHYKWLRGLITDGYLWAIPAWANAVLCVDLDAYWGRRERQQRRQENNDNENENDSIVHLIPLPKDHPSEMRWQWHGGALNHNKTAIYCVPSNARHVLKVDIRTKTTSLIDIEYNQTDYPDFHLDVTNKWYGGIVGDDGAIYGSPYRASGVLRIDPTTDTAHMIGPNYGVGKYYWHGGLLRHGKIYAMPSHADTVLVTDTTQTPPVIHELPIHGIPNNTTTMDHATTTTTTTRTATNYKWLGGAIGADGNIYCPACDTTHVLRINVTTGVCETLSSGFCGTEKNKWQGGILGRDNCIYCIPANGEHVCRIATDPNSIAAAGGEPPVQLIGNLPPHKDKWQGAAEGMDGSLYFIPENGYRVMKVTPPQEPPMIINGKLPKNDVIIEFM